MGFQGIDTANQRRHYVEADRDAAGVAEVLGAIGLILPGLLRIRPGLTPLAAAGLVMTMIGATVITLVGGDLAAALISLVVGLLAAFVAYGRRPSARVEKQDGKA